MKTTKLAFITQFPSNPQRPSGGVEAVSVNLIRGLAIYEDLDIHVVTLSESVDAPVDETWMNASVHRFPRPSGTELVNAVSRSRSLITRIVNEMAPDLIHAHDTYGIMTQNIDIPKVFTVHGFIHGDTLLAGHRFAYLRSLLWRIVEVRNWNRQPNIISISPYVRERVSRSSRANIFDVENPISEDFFKLERNERAGVVFTSAVITPRKNLLTLVKAIEILAKSGVSVELRVAGADTDPSYAQQVKSYVEQNGLTKNVTFLGRIDSTAVMQELSITSVYALLSLEENSPIGIEEAMAAGIPVITSNRCGMPYMVRNLQSGMLVDPNNVELIAKKLKRMLQDDVLRRSMGLMASETARNLYHVESVAARTKSVYDELLLE